MSPQKSQIPASPIPDEVKTDWESLQQALAAVNPVVPTLFTMSAAEIKAKIAEDSDFGNSVGILADLCDKYAPNWDFVRQLTQS